MHSEDRPWAPINNKNPPSKVSGGKQVTVPFRGKFSLDLYVMFCFRNLRSDSRFLEQQFQNSLIFAGSEFVLGVRAFYCTLCREFSGDADCALTHLKSKQHDEKYQVLLLLLPPMAKWGKCVRIVNAQLIQWRE